MFSNLIPVPGNEEGCEGAVAHGGEELLLHGAGEMLARQADRRALGLPQVVLGVAGHTVEHAHPALKRNLRFCVIRLPRLPGSRQPIAGGNKRTAEPQPVDK